MKSEWTDCGDYEDLICDYGRISLQPRPSYCDRGRFVVQLLIHGPTNHLLSTPLSNAYFFSYQNAKEEIARWLTLAASATPEQLRTLKPETSREQCLHMSGLNCEAKVYQQVLQPVNTTMYIFEVEIKPGNELALDVNEADEFPRVYLDLGVARQEVLAWMQCRGQIDQTLIG